MLRGCAAAESTKPADISKRCPPLLHTRPAFSRFCTLESCGTPFIVLRLGLWPAHPIQPPQMLHHRIQTWNLACLDRLERQFPCLDRERQHSPCLDRQKLHFPCLGPTPAWNPAVQDQKQPRQNQKSSALRRRALRSRARASAAARRAAARSSKVCGRATPESWSEADDADAPLSPAFPRTLV